MNFSESNFTEFNYIYKENEENKDEALPVVEKITITMQTIMRTNVLDEAFFTSNLQSPSG